MKKVLVTGADGFVGRHLCKWLAARGFEVIGTSRSIDGRGSDTGYSLRRVGDIGGNVDWLSIVDGADFLVHLAARVHVMQDTVADPLAEFRRVNVEGTRRLLDDAVACCIRRVVFVSTVKVHGEATGQIPFTSADSLSPKDPYSQSKLEAERLLKETASSAGFEAVIIRPPLVYGPGVGGNFIRLLKLIEDGVPLPVGSIVNLRSLVYVENLCDLICECLVKPSAAGKKFLVSDNRDISTPTLIRQIAHSMSRPARLMTVPPAVLTFLAKILGRSTEVARLIESLQVNIEDTMNTLNWAPPVSFDAGIKATVDWYRQGQRGD